MSACDFAHLRPWNTFRGKRTNARDLKLATKNTLFIYLIVHLSIRPVGLLVGPSVSTGEVSRDKSAQGEVAETSQHRIGTRARANLIRITESESRHLF